MALVVLVADNFRGEQDAQNNRNRADAANHDKKDIFHNAPHLGLTKLMIPPR